VAVGGRGVAVGGASVGVGVFVLVGGIGVLVVANAVGVLVPDAVVVAVAVLVPGPAVLVAVAVTVLVPGVGVPVAVAVTVLVPSAVPVAVGVAVPGVGVVVEVGSPRLPVPPGRKRMSTFDTTMSGFPTEMVTSLAPATRSPTSIGSSRVRQV